VLKGKFRIIMLVAFVLVTGLLLTGCPAEEETAVEQEPTFPTGNIIWAISRDPGDGQDITARLLAPYLAQELGVNVAVDNKPGAGGRVGFSELFRQNPDGYYLGQDVLGQMANFHVLGELDHPLEEIEWFSIIFKSPAALWVGADSEIKTIQDLIDLDRPVLIGETSLGGTHVPWTIGLFNALGIEFDYVTGFGGRPEIATAAMRLEIDAVSSSVSGYAAQAEAGDLRALLIMGEERHPLLPDTPTLGEVAAELGNPDIEKFLPMGMAIYMVGAPPGTPREVTKVFEDAFQRIIEENEEFKAKAAEAKVDTVFMGYDETRAMLAEVIAILEDMDIKSIIEGLEQ